MPYIYAYSRIYIYACIHTYRKRALSEMQGSFAAVYPDVFIFIYLSVYYLYARITQRTDQDKGTYVHIYIHKYIHVYIDTVKEPFAEM